MISFLVKEAGQCDMLLEEGAAGRECEISFHGQQRAMTTILG